MQKIEIILADNPTSAGVAHFVTEANALLRKAGCNCVFRFVAIENVTRFVTFGSESNLAVAEKHLEPLLAKHPKALMVRKAWD